MEIFMSQSLFNFNKKICDESENLNMLWHVLDLSCGEYGGHTDTSSFYDLDLFIKSIIFLEKITRIFQRVLQAVCQTV